jgi:VanZ family protein
VSGEVLEAPTSPAPPRKARSRGWLAAGLGLASLYTGWLLWMTLRGARAAFSAYETVYSAVDAAGRHSFDPTLLIDVAGNIAVFIPLGLLLAAVAGGSWRRRALVAILAGAVLSGFIETVQRGVPGRVSSAEDWLLNVLGTALGAALRPVSGIPFRRRERRGGATAGNC